LGGFDGFFGEVADFTRHIVFLVVNLVCGKPAGFGVLVGF
jgi:hypothetical protein